jgi:hypothetical protein
MSSTCALGYPLGNLHSALNMLETKNQTAECISQDFATCCLIDLLHGVYRTKISRITDYQWIGARLVELRKK